jgi:hypothetical protein
MGAFQQRRRRWCGSPLLKRRDCLGGVGQLGANVAEGGTDGATEPIEGRYSAQPDQSCNEGILDQVLTGVLPQQIPKYFTIVTHRIRLLVDHLSATLRRESDGRYQPRLSCRNAHLGGKIRLGGVGQLGADAFEGVPDICTERA